MGRQSVANPFHRQPLTSELVGGSIANWMELPWPVTHPAMLGAAVHQKFRETFPESSSDVAVAISYVPDLTRIDYEEPGRKPEGISRLQDDQWLKAIRRGLAPYVSVPANRDALYGRSTIDNWLLAQDGKTDQLQLTGDLFVLLDASACLGGVSWSIAEHAATAARRSYSGLGGQRTLEP